MALYWIMVVDEYVLSDSGVALLLAGLDLSMMAIFLISETHSKIEGDSI